MKRFVQQLLVLIAVFLSAGGWTLLAAEESRPHRKPNIVLILADDLGWRDLACYGSTFHETPHLDALARNGMKFTQAYASCAVCSPTRASLMTGKSPARLHLTHIIQAAPARKGDWRDPDWTPYLRLEESTLAEALKPAGYATGLIGKWHLGGHRGRSEHCDGAEGDPLRQGFEFNIAGSDLGQPPDYFFPYSRTLADGETHTLHPLEGGKPGEYLTDRLTDETEAFLERNKDRPFFLFLSHFAPHTSMGDRLQAPDTLVEHFEAKVDPKDPQHNPVYAAMVASLDASVGRVLRKLKDLGLSENTLVIFTSDNGGYGTKTSNLPLRGAKHTPYEGGLRVPTLIQWPARVKAGRECETPVITHDLFVTILETARVAVPTSKEIDGVSLLPLLEGTGTLARTSLYWHYPHCDTEPYSIVRRGDLKLIEFLRENRSELYDLRSDPRETTDASRRSPDTASDLRNELETWRKGVGAQMPQH